MKRALIVFLMLAVMAGGLFAQITFSGGAETGVGVFIEDGITLAMRRDESWKNWTNAEVNASLDHESGRAGASAGFNTDGGWGGELWFKPLDILKVSAGDIGWYWKAGGPGSVGNNNNADVGAGIIFELSPGNGIDLAAAVYPNGGFADAVYAGWVKYGLSGVFNAAANVEYNRTGGDYAKDMITAGAGVGISALSGLGIPTIAVDVVARNVNELSTSGWLAVGPRIDFKFGDFGAGARANLYIPVSGQEQGLAVGVWGQYPIAGITARLGAGYSMGRTISDTTGEAFDYYADWSHLPKGYATAGVESAVLGVRPSISFGAAGGNFNVGYGFYTHIGGTPKTKSALYTFYNVSF